MGEVKATEYSTREYTAADGNVHKYFSPYKAPADAYVNFMNVLADFRIRLLAKVGQ